VSAVTFKGRTNGTGSSQGSLQISEFKDSSYANQISTETVFDGNLPTAEATTTKVENLSLVLKPYFYYRLDTLGGFQNESMILAGTNSTGTAMWNEFVYDTGRVEHVYPFMPFIVMEGEPLTSAEPVPLTAPQNATTSFDTFSMQLSVSWASSTDPEWPANPLHYEFNYSTSTELSANGWQSVGVALQKTIPIEVGENYLLGVRAADNFGGVSAATILNWNFPADFVALPSETDHSSGLPSGRQKITLASATTIDGLALWVGPGDWNSACCSASFLSIYKDADSSLGDLVAQSEDVIISQDDGPTEHIYYFSSPVALAAGSYWLGIDVPPNVGRTNGTSVFGSAGDAYAGGFWADSLGRDTGRDAYFRLQAAQ
jgi:hypothetical protein